MQLDGDIISGEFDQYKNEFMLEQVKHLSTESILNEKQINALAGYLHQNKHESDGQVLTLYDQILVHLSQEEVGRFLNDLEEIKSRCH